MHLKRTRQHEPADGAASPDFCTRRKRMRSLHVDDFIHHTVDRLPSPYPPLLAHRAAHLGGSDGDRMDCSGGMVQAAGAAATSPGCPPSPAGSGSDAEMGDAACVPGRSEWGMCDDNAMGMTVTTVSTWVAPR